jgi:N-acetylneuraminic acid mutarotase
MVNNLFKMRATIHWSISKLIFLSLLIALTSCKKEQIIEQIPLTSPSIKIDTSFQTSLSTYKVQIHIDAGEGLELKKAEIIFDDITLLSAPDIVKEIQLSNGKKQIDTTILLNTITLDHDFSIKAKLITNSFTYYSESKIVRCIKNLFVIDVRPNDMYQDLKSNIADFINPGDKFSLTVNYLNLFKPTTVEVKLNRTISLNHNLNFAFNFDGDYLTTQGDVFIPNDLQPGVYEIYVYIDGIEFKSKNNIKVLKGTWQKFDPKFIGETRGEYASFLKDDNIYVIGGEFDHTQLTSSPVWKYNFTNNSWQRQNDFHHPGDITLNKILPFSLQYNNQAYIVLKNNTSVEIWRYNDETDTWYLLTYYPGKAIEQLTCFILNGKLFLGGGSRYFSGNLDENSYYDFWEYNFETKKWAKKNDIPIKRFGMEGNLACCTQDNKVFVFSYANELWQYNPEQDSWSRKMKFPGPTRIISNLIEKNNKLYLIGGSYSNYGSYGLKDCWEYTINSNSWEMVAFMPQLYSYGIAFTYNDQIYTGLGWVVNGYSALKDQNFYQLGF